MELISRISKGSRMDQIYIPKNRHGFGIGNYVVITPFNRLQEKKPEKLYFYHIGKLEPIKIKLTEEIFAIISKFNTVYNNIIISGSFLEKGFNFNDIDILIITEEKTDTTRLKKEIENSIGIKPHILLLDNNSLSAGLSTDPLYQLMLSKCISKKRIIYRIKKETNYKLLDIHLLKSKMLIDNFDILNGNEKYYLTRNMLAILLFLKSKKISKDIVDSEIKKLFNLEASQIKGNLLDKGKFLKKYREIYNKTFNLIMEGVKNAKQK